MLKNMIQYECILERRRGISQQRYIFFVEDKVIILTLSKQFKEEEHQRTVYYTISIILLFKGG